MKPILALVLFSFALSAIADAAPVGPVTSQSIVEALKPTPRTRGIVAHEDRLSPAQAALVGNLRGKTRAIQVEERTELATIVAKPSVRRLDLEVFFPLNSADITPQATSVLVQLGLALTTADLRGGVFVVSGHTDVTGAAAFNLDLSQARAASVKRFLVEKFRVDPSTLIAVGYGSEHLRNPADPTGGENRRVEIANLPVF